MPIKTILFMAGSVVALIGSVVVHPFIGLAGYLLSYNINPTSFWWGQNLPGLFQRSSLIFTIACLLGMIIHWSKLKFKSFINKQEVYLILYILVICLSTVVGVQTEMLGYNTEKMVKVSIILLMASHLVTDFKLYKIMTWLYVFSAFVSAYEIYSSSSLVLSGGRLHVGVGGGDFREGNFLALHYIMIFPWVGIYFLTGKWKEKLFCMATAAFCLNTLILIKSRGSFLAIGAGIIYTLLVVGKQYRNKIIMLLVIAAAMFVYLSDASFWTRMDTIDVEGSAMDKSSSTRLVAWQVAIEMFKDYPLGAGEGNFKVLGDGYNPDLGGHDTHNTFFRCLSELGIFGITLLLLMIQNAFSMLKKIRKKLDLRTQIGQEYSLHIFALRTSLVMYLVGTMFVSHTYVEEIYWLLMLPLFLQRCYENETF